MKHLRLILKSWLAGWRYETAWRVLLSKVAELYSILKARLFSRTLLFHAPMKRLLPQRQWEFLLKMNLIGHLRNKPGLTNAIKGDHFSIKTLIRIWSMKKTSNVFIIIIQKMHGAHTFEHGCSIFFVHFPFSSLLNIRFLYCASLFSSFWLF